MGFLANHALVSTIASILLVWFLSKTALVLKDRQRLKKMVSLHFKLFARSRKPNGNIRKRPIGFGICFITSKRYHGATLLSSFKSGPPIHPIFGHILSIAKVAMKLPTRAHPHLLAAYMKREYDLPGVFWLDTRPISVLNLIVTDP